MAVEVSQDRVEADEFHEGLRATPSRSLGLKQEYQFGDGTKAAVNKAMDKIADFTGKDLACDKGKTHDRNVPEECKN